jgi:hypothetical protein
VPSAGTCARESKPGSADTGWISLATIEGWEDSISDEEEKSVFKPVPGHLVKQDVITLKQGLNFKFTCNELSPLSVEAFYRTTQKLTTASTQFNPLSAVPRKGWLKVQRYDHNDSLRFTLDVFGRLKVSGGMRGAQGELVMPEFDFEVLYSSLNTASL